MIQVLERSTLDDSRNAIDQNAENIPSDQRALEVFIWFKWSPRDIHFILIRTGVGIDFQFDRYCIG